MKSETLAVPEITKVISHVDCANLRLVGYVKGFPVFNPDHSPAAVTPESVKGLFIITPEGVNAAPSR